MKQCPFCAGVIPDFSTVCKHCKQSIPSPRARQRQRRGMPVWALVVAGVGLVAVAVPALVWLRPVASAGGATEEGRRAQLVSGLQAAERMATEKVACESPTAVADAWRLVKLVRRADPDYDQARKMTGQLETCRAGIASALAGSVGTMRRQQRVAHAESVRREFQTQGFDTVVAVTGADRDQALISSPQLTTALIERVTSSLSMATGSFLETWQKLGCTRVTFTDGRRRWAYDLPHAQDGLHELSVLTGMGLGSPLALP